ncbi:MAG: DUF4097 family beta strand repeat protein [Bacilli bacterium]|nr:DUF4097 family beta strand repeat protein [Bacilli bacterium]
MKIKVFIISAVSLIVVGLTVAIVTLAANQFNIGELTEELVPNTYSIEGEFNSIECDLDTADVDILYISEGESFVSSLENNKISFMVEVVDGVLKIIENTKIENWYDFVNWSSVCVDLYINKNAFTNVTIKNDTGDINILDAFKIDNLVIDSDTSNINLSGLEVKSLDSNLSTGDFYIENSSITSLKSKTSTGESKIRNCKVLENVTIEASTGKIYLENFEIGGKLHVTVSTGKIEISETTCDSYESSSSTGTVKLTDLVVTNDMNIKTSTGDVKLNSIDAANIYIKTSTGDVTGTIRSDKIFFLDSNTGKEDSPFSTTGGICKVTTDTGDITLDYE